MRCLSVRSVHELKDCLVAEGLAPDVSNDLAVSQYPCSLFIDQLAPPVAAILLEEMKKAGGGSFWVRSDAARPEKGVSVILSGSPNEFVTLAGSLEKKRDLKESADISRELLSLVDRIRHSPPPPIHYHDKQLDFSGKPLLMGVLNVTPDSFFDGGLYFDPEKAAERAFELIDQGADILDIGGASSRPGSEFVSDDEQTARVLPIVRAVRSRWDGWISVDTYSSRVAGAAIEQGADMINDISAGCIDPEIKTVAKQAGVPCILMHMKGTPQTMQQDPVYESLIPEIMSYFEERIRDWTDTGVSQEKILIDPGIGFGKTVRHNLSILKNLSTFEMLGRPIVLGTSRKSFIGAVLGREVHDRLVGTLASLVVGAQNGAHVFRVHDVREAWEALTLFHAVRRA